MFQMVTVEDLVPKDHFLRQLDAAIDLSFIRERVRGLYDERMGRPSVDPELVLRMFLLSYLFDLSENRLCDEIGMHAGYRWFCRLDFHDPVPDRSTLVKLRCDRWGPGGVFDTVMRQVVQACVEAGVVSGAVLSLDGTLVNARAATRSLEKIEPVEPAVDLESYLQRTKAADEAEKESDDEPPEDPPATTRKAGDPDFHGERFSNATHRSKTDPDARLYTKGGHQETKLRFMAHNLVDTDSGVILDTGATLATGRAECEAGTIMVSRVRERGVDPDYLWLDGGYTKTSFLETVLDAGIKPLVPIHGEAESLPTWKRRTFQRDRLRKRKEKIRHAEVRNEGRALRQREIYRETYGLRLRSEHRFAEGKEWHGLDRARGYGLPAMDTQAKFTATVQNLKRLVRWNRRRGKAASQAGAAKAQQAAKTAAHWACFSPSWALSPIIV